MFSIPPLSVAFCLTLTWGKFSVIIISNISSISFSLLLVFPVCIHYTFCGCPAVFWYLILVLFSPQPLFSSLLSWMFLLRFPVTERFFPLCVQSPKSIKGILHFSFSVFDLQHSFRFFRRISISLLTVPICSCTLSTLHIRALGMLIRVVLNPPPDNSNIPAMSNSDACSVSSDCVFAFWCAL